MRIAIVDYGAGNTRSVQYALNRIGCESVLSDDPQVLNNADGVIIPGVGHASHAMNSLKEKGLIDTLKSFQQPVLGICLGMQLMCESSEEGDELGLGIINESVKKFKSDLPVPQIGWNKIQTSDSKLFENISNESYFYFVHSYYVPTGENTSAKTEYGISFSAAIQKDNYYACQFHPEKSGEVGEQLLKNFIRICESYQQ